MNVVESSSAKHAVAAPLFKGAEEPDERWYVLYTVARHEKSVETMLKRARIESYLPLRRSHRQWRDRRKLVEFPLFPCYLFVRTRAIERFPILNLPGVVRMLGNGNEPTPIPEEDIMTIRALVESGLNYEPVDNFPPGAEVVVSNGSLKGVHGRIERKRGPARLIISVELIQRSVAVEVDVDDLDLAG